MDRPIITGVRFPADLTTPVDTISDSAKWGWFSNRVGPLSVTACADRDTCYRKAGRIANRSRGSVQIYANTGDGWRQVDTVQPPKVELCEWWPAVDGSATGASGEGCGKPAAMSVGVSTNWHLCESCRALPAFRRLSVRGHIN